MNKNFNSGRLIIISGPAGAGKDSVVCGLTKKDDRFSVSVSATTRSPRTGEKDGVHYYFISDREFLDKIKRDEFIEYTQYGINRYGTLKSDVENKINQGKVVILVIEVEGASNVKRLYPDCTSIFILPPSLEILEKRLRGRNTECEEDIQRRLKIAENEIKQKENYDYIVYNDELDKTVNETYNLIINKCKI